MSVADRRGYAMRDPKPFYSGRRRVCANGGRVRGGGNDAGEGRMLTLARSPLAVVLRRRADGLPSAERSPL